MMQALFSLDYFITYCNQIFNKLSYHHGSYTCLIFVISAGAGAYVVACREQELLSLNYMIAARTCMYMNIYIYIYIQLEMGHGSKCGTSLWTSVGQKKMKKDEKMTRTKKNFGNCVQK